MAMKEIYNHNDYLMYNSMIYEIYRINFGIHRGGLLYVDRKSSTKNYNKIRSIQSNIHDKITQTALYMAHGFRPSVCLLEWPNIIYWRGNNKLISNSLFMIE